MARRKTNGTPAPAPGAIELDPNAGEEEFTDPLDEVLSSLAGASDAVITVYRGHKNDNLKYLFRCDPGAFSLDELRDRYNGGDFRLYVTRAGRLYKNIPISVEAPSRADVAPAINTGQADLLVAIERQTQTMRDVIATLSRPAAPPPAPPVNVSELITAMTGAITALHRVASPPAPPAAVVAAPEVSQEKLFDVLLKGIELGKSFVPGGEGDGGILGAVKDLLKSPIVGQAVSAMAQGAIARRAGNPPPRRQIVARAPDVTPPAPAPAPAAAPSPADQQASYVAQLVAWAAEDADPEFYAAFIADNVPEDYLRAFVEREDSIDSLALVNPEVNTYRPWFESLKNQILTILTDPGKSAPTDPDLTGERAHAINDPHAPGSSAAHSTGDDS